MEINQGSFSCKHSDKTDAITISIHDEVLFQTIKSALSASYVFQTNKNNSGIESTIFEDNDKCVVTIYYNKTIFLQGKGCHRWKNNVLNKMLDDNDSSCSSLPNASDILLQNNCQNVDSPLSTMSSPSSPSNGSPYTPRRLLHKLVNSLRSPGKQTPFKQKPINNDHLKTISSTNASSPLSSPVVNVVNSPTMSFSPVVTTSSASHSSPTSPGTNQTHVKQVITDGLSLKEMEKSIKQLKSKLNDQVEKTEKLDSELAKMKTNLKTQTERNDVLVSELNHLKKELSKSTAKCLCLEEEKTKMKLTVDRLSKEKSELVTQLIKMENKSESAESLLQNLTDCVEIKVESEIRELKKSLLGELSEIKSSISLANVQRNQSRQPASTNFNQSTVKPSASGNVSSLRNGNPIHCIEILHPSRSSVSDKLASSDPSSSTVSSKQHESRSVISSTSSSTSSPFSTSTNKQNVLIFGDSITKRLSPAKLSDSSISTKIRSRPGATTESLNKQVKEIKIDDKELIKSANIVIIHVGTNDVSNGVSPQQIISNLKEIAGNVKSVNSNVVISFSSILPRRSEKVVNDIVLSVNKEIETMCKLSGYNYLDNDPFILKDGRVQFSLFSDHVHLNTYGGRLFGNHIKHNVVLLTKSRQNEPDVIVVDELSPPRNQNFRNGRSFGRSPYQNNRNIHHNRNRYHQYNRDRDMMYFPMPAWAFNNRY